MHASFGQPSMKEDELRHARSAQSEPGQTAFEVDQSRESEAAFGKAVYDTKNGPAGDSSIKKKLTSHKFCKQSTKREMQSKTIGCCETSHSGP